MSTRSLASRISVAVAAAAAALTAGSADADLDPGREIIRTGDTVPGLGRIGTLIANPIGIDAEGRAIAAVYLDDGSRALVRADGKRLEPIWRHAEGGDADTPSVDAPIVSPDGARVATLGGLQISGSTATERLLYDLSSGTPQVLLAAGDHTADGWPVVGLNYFGGINDVGAVLISAQIATPGADPATGTQAVLLRDADGTHVVISTAGDTPPFLYVQPVGIDAAGTAIAYACRTDSTCTVFRYQQGTLEPLIAPGDPGPNGSAVTSADALASAANGEVLAAISQEDGSHSLVRTEAGRLIHVRDAADPLPDGRPFSIRSAYLNARGDVSLAGVAGGASDAGTAAPSDFAVLLYPADGTPRLLPAPSLGGQINDAGQVVLRLIPAGEPARVVRWDRGTVRTLISARTATPDGATAVAAGLGGSCLADDGRVAVLATAENETQAWTCIDQTGPHRLSPASPAVGLAYPYSVRCAFAGPDEVVVLTVDAVSRLGTDAVGVVRVGDHLPDGRRVTGIGDISVNAAGTLVASVGTDAGQSAVRQERGGTLELVEFHLTGAAVTDVLAAGIADDGTVSAVVTLDTGATALVSEQGPNGQVLRNFGTLGEELYFGRLLVRGESAVVSLNGYDGTTRTFLFDLSTGSGEEILQSDTLAEPETNASVFDLATSGDLLYQTTVPGTLDSPNSTWRWRAGNAELLSHADSGYGPANQPYALNAAGDLLLFAPGSATGALYRLSLSGPAPSAACPGQAQSSSSADNNGCQIAPGPTATGWSLLLPLLLLRAARRRRAAAGSEARATGTS